MKKLTILLGIILLSFSAVAQQWMPITSPRPVAPITHLVTSTEQTTTVTLSLEGFLQTAVATPQGTQYIITVPKMASMLEEGAPDLPLFAIPVLIDDEAKMEVRIDDSKYKDFENIEIAPSKGNLSREVDPASVPFRYGEMYSQNAFYPASQAQLDQPYILRDFRAGCEVCACRYDQ